MQNELWEQDDFEHKVTASLIAMYEEKYSSWSGRLIKEYKISKNELISLKQIGPYFSPYDRIASNSEVDLRNDGIPENGFIGSIIPDEFTDGDTRGYAHFVGFFKTKKLPEIIKRTGPGIPYKVFMLTAKNEGGFLMMKYFLTLCLKSGQAYPTYNRNLGFDFDRFKLNTGISDDTLYDLTCGFYRNTSIWADKRFLWNVEAREHAAKASFGVYPEQIKSLFYARDLPMSSTGRKRPILHWVASHRRRMRMGTDIDISKHLRGIESFEMNGTKFTITQPIKKAERYD